MTVTTDTIPSQTYHVVHHKGTDLDRVFVVIDAYDRSVDVSGLNWKVSIGLLDAIGIDDEKLEVTGTAASDTDTAEGRLHIRIPAAIIDAFMDDMIMGANYQWKLEIHRTDGSWARPYAGDFVYVWW